MKKLVTLFVSAAMLVSTLAFATDSDNVNARVKSSFLNDFATATNISWEKSSDFYFATFTINNVEFNAAYTVQGELVGTSRSIESSQMPMSITMAVAKKYNGYVVSKKALELTFEGDTRYYVTVSNEKQAVKLKCTANGSLEVERKIKKK